MSKKFIQILSIFLTIILVVNMLPLSVLAQSLQAQTANTAQIASKETETPQILEELTEKRTEYTKQFRLSNGLQMAVLYPNAVHYEKDGNWAEIDNTLTAKTEGAYSNTAGVWDVHFPRQLSSQNSVVIEKDGYTLSFSLDGELKTGNMQNIQAQATAGVENFQTFATQTADAAVIPVDMEEMRQNTEHPETLVEQNYARLRYEDVFSNTNILYDLQSNTVKESIVLEAYDPQLRGYRYSLNVGQLTPVLQESGQIDFYGTDKETIIMSMPAPYMVDAAGEYCADVQVQLIGKGSTYVLTYTLSHSWLSEDARAWPVIVDPVVSADLSRSNIEDRTVAQQNENGEGWGMNACGYSAKYGVHRCYLQYLELPALTSSDVIIGATLKQYKAYASSTITTVEVHKVTEPWRSANITWSDKPDFNTQIEDYAIVDPVAWYSWDVTDIVRDWYASENTGMMFKASDAIETGGTDNFKQFLSENYGVAEYRPQLEIVFRNNNGLESYWDYTSASAGRAGTGYVNTYTGNLVWTRSDMGFGGNRMPVSISHIYNANDSTIPTDENNSNDTGGNYFGLGNGWRTNYHQRVSQWSEDSTYYLWEDGDGTDHYFKYLSANTYKDEDGLELTLTTGGSGDSTYLITDKYDSTSYFDSYGRLVKLENNQKVKSSVVITYTTASGPLISTITDGAGRVYSFAYTDGMLTRISYLGNEAYQTAHAEDGNAEISYVAFAYDASNNLTTVTDKDGEACTYFYSGNILTAAQDIDGYKVTYTYYTPANTWQPYRVTGIAESHNGTDGGSMTIEYAHNQTRFTDHNDTVLIKQFNNSGNTVCIQDDEGHAQYAKYAFDFPAGETVANSKNNQLRLSSNMQNTVGNRLKNSGFENASAWYGNSSNITVARSTEYAYEGDYSLKLVSSASSTVAGLCPNFPVEPGETYTFSAYVKTTTGKAVVALHCGADNTSKLGTGLKYDKDWTRLSVTYTNDTDATRNMCPVLFLTVPGTVYMDCIQVEKCVTPSRFNLMENGDFRHGTDGWTGSAYTTTSTAPAAPTLESTAVQVTGSPTATKQLSQTVKVEGEKDETLILTGWAKGDSAPLTGSRTFGMTATLNYTDGTTGDPVTVSFNPDAHSDISWQYAATPIVATKAYSSVTVKLCYDYNVNTALFDGIQLYKEEFGSSYTYDEDGNITSVVDLQKQKTSYDYTDNDLTQMIMPTGATYTYEYDNYHNVETATTELGLVYRFEYDDYGNNTSVSIGSGENTMSSSADYTDDGNRIDFTTDALGKITTYGYNEQTNMLEWVQYPEDTEETRTEYTYDAMYRMATAAASTDTELDMSVEYTYTDDYLTKVETPTTAYDFTYGNFGLRTSVKIGNRSLATYHYTASPNFYLEKLDYGNNGEVQYEYDNKGRLICETYEDGDTVTYQYDNDGALASVTDSATGITTQYFYDFTGRTTKYVETGTGYSHSVEYTYDAINNLSTQIETIDGASYTTSYTYDADNRVTSKTTDGITVEYTYDGFGRITQQLTKNGDTTILTETYTFNGNSSQIYTHRTQTSSYDVTYTYTYDDNGNILTINDGTNETSYVYDSQNQLIRENNQAGGFTHTWTYDNAGNIQNRAEYAYTTGDLTNVTVTDTAGYTYGDEDWGDLLTAYDGTAITYDGIGNPTTYDGYTLTWEHGRELATMSQNGQTWEFTYDANGMRTKRTDGTAAGTYEYVYENGLLTRMTLEETREYMYFSYSEDGIPVSFVYDTDPYYYITNAQGDVVGIQDCDGNIVARYSYDAWGKPLTEFSAEEDHIAYYNPLRYRGYVYDQETGLYYLQSRYYDPETGRFLNADEMVSTGQGLTGNNTFVYCGNHPVLRKDSNGNWWKVFKVAVGAAVGAVFSAASEIASQTVNYIATGEPIDWGDVVTSTFSGAAYGAAYALTDSKTYAKAAEAAVGTIVGGIIDNDSIDTIVKNTIVNTGKSLASSYASKRVNNYLSQKSSGLNKLEKMVKNATDDEYRGKYARPNHLVDSLVRNYKNARSDFLLNSSKSIFAGAWRLYIRLTNQQGSE